MIFFRKVLILLAILAIGIASKPDYSNAATSVNNNPVVRLDTSLGTIDLQLDSDKAPITVANFIQYVKSGHYDGTVFHRVIKNFMIQGGGMTTDMVEKKTRSPIRNEAGNGLKNKKYTIAMARTSDPHSASAQFFINTNDNRFLDYKVCEDGWGYAVFGKVIRGNEVVDRISAVGTSSKGFHKDVPTTPVIIKKAEVLSGE